MDFVKKVVFLALILVFGHENLWAMEADIKFVVEYGLYITDITLSGSLTVGDLIKKVRSSLVAPTNDIENLEIAVNGVVADRNERLASVASRCQNKLVDRWWVNLVIEPKATCKNEKALNFWVKLGDSDDAGVVSVCLPAFATVRDLLYHAAIKSSNKAISTQSLYELGLFVDGRLMNAEDTLFFVNSVAKSRSGGFAIVEIRKINNQ